MAEKERLTILHSVGDCKIYNGIYMGKGMNIEVETELLCELFQLLEYSKRNWNSSQELD